MENNKRRGAGGITFLMLIVILFGALWFTNQIEQKERELSYSEFRSLVEEGNAVDGDVSASIGHYVWWYSAVILHDEPSEWSQ